MPPQRHPPPALAHARRLRHEQTDAEAVLWDSLRGRRFAGLKFRRQHPVSGFILDFFCPALGLAIEVDGGQHLQLQQREVDAQRTAILAEQHGIKLIRVWDHEVLKDREVVLRYIKMTVDEILSLREKL